MSLNELYQELIIDHGTEPRNHYCLDNFTNDAKGFNPLCGDKVHVYLKLDKNIITDVSFEGNGCAISMASASIMTEVLIGKNVEQAQLIFTEFKNLVTGINNNTTKENNKVTNKDNTKELPEDSFDKLAALAGVREYPSRVKCATLAWHTMNSAINNEIDLIKTE